MDLSPVTSMTLRGWRMSFLPFNEVGKALQVPITRQTHISSWEGQNGAEQNFWDVPLLLLYTKMRHST